ncbi:MAG TPA: CoA transferase [Candidatus Copromorpha excrementigallinarum]|uniref:CoA transferase n=1 Tax=Candidatus Allocopromorpha excrementigallinarum TaxID=2840742 RepID=A0A9D1I0F5_9FIRM|nr:CoA transferase [Candidatus Copromorpha excrementigallinarum]
MKPLEGIKIIDFTLIHGGPLATRLLADFGAEIIKIERVDGGEPGRLLQPKDENSGSGYFAYLNRGKKSISLDLSSDEGKKIIYRLAEDADAVVENYPYGVMKKHGLDYTNLKKINPKIIYASLSGYGHTGPRKEMELLDVQAQSMSGISSITGYPDQAPTRSGAELGCHVGGTYLATAVMIALISREKTGKGQMIDVSMVDSILATIEAAPIEYLIEGTERERTGNAYPSICPYDTFDTNDGSVSIGVSTDRQWGLFCEALGLEELIDDPRYRTNETRGANYRNGLRDLLQRKISAMSRFEVEKLMKEKRIPCGIVYEVSEAMRSDTVKERHMLIDVEDHTMGTVRMPGPAIKIDGKEEEITGAPRCGENTAEYLEKLGYTRDEIRAMEKKGTVGLL